MSTLSRKILTQYVPAVLGIVLIVSVATMTHALSARADDATTTPPDTQQSVDDTTPAPDTTTPDSDSSADAPADATSTPGQGGDATVVTGDAASNTDAQNTLNTNDTSASSTDPNTNQNASTTVSDTNAASVGTAASADADSGSNAATTTDGNASVSTGNAVASANVINVVNTNLFGSQGLLEFLNAFFAGGLDLRSLDLSYFFGGAPAAGGCSLSSCNQGSLNVSNNNTATVSNDVVVRSNTGGNTASTTGSGDASISTGDAAASANVLNVVNSNLINSHYLLLAFNNFGNLNGDLTLPDAAFFNQLLAGQGGAAQNTTVNNTNNATITNNNTADADSGSNTASTTGSGDASVSTGNAVSGATTVNQVNTNAVGGTTVFMLVNIFGNWTGNVQGLPPGISWAQTPTGIMLTGGSLGALTDPNANAPATNPASNALASLTSSSTNTADINNNVQAYALTGDNYAGAQNGDASVSTGNAYASSNIINVVNTNILGQNWILAIFNIFGNWTGNLSFGHPNLWIGAVAQTPNPTPPGSTVTYDFTVSNRGDADATNVTLTAAFNRNMLDFQIADATSSDGVVWDLGTIPQGTTKDFTYTAVAGKVPANVVAVPLTATVASDETDDDLSDNTDQVTIVVGQELPSFAGGSATSNVTSAPNITMVKTVSVATTTVPASVDYKVDVENSGGPAYNAMLTDTLTDPNGKTVYTRSWNLDTIDTGDDVTLTYSVDFDANTAPGIYTNTARLTGQQGNTAWQYAYDMTPVQTTAQVEVDPGGGDVLGAETDIPDCTQFLTAYIKPGAKNNASQVKLLQYFLNNFQGEKSVKQTGTYDSSTIAAVSRFQTKYGSDVLMPWGVSTPTDVVFYTTEKEINNLYCQGRANFPLTDSQKQYIATHHR